MSQERIAVCGAGALGLSVALHGLWHGRAVTLFEPAPLGDNASGIAAGMLAAEGEARFDPASRSHLPLLRHAQDLWPGFASRVGGIEIDRAGARLADDPAARLDDWRLQPMKALQAMRTVFKGLGGQEIRALFREEDAAAFDAVAVCTGSSKALTGLAPELACLSPVKGHILRFAAGPRDGPILRGEGLYLVPQPEGVAAGASMEPGRDDRRIDPAVTAELHARALDLMPALASAPMDASAGVRAQTPDGLPLAGPSRRPGVWIGAGARRNGWLLAPLVGAIVADGLAGRQASPWAAALDPRRFA